MTLEFCINIVFFFFVYSMLGWIWESCYESVLNKKPLNRGFFIGPYIPLYGFGGLGGYLILQRFQAPLLSVGTVKIYLIGAIGATVLEYITSYVLEKTLKARWWDYTNYPLNINGRICLIATLFWGLIGIVAVDFLNPFLLRVKGVMSHDAQLIILTVLSTTLFIDFCVTINSVLDLHKRLQLVLSMEKDTVFEKFAETKEAFIQYKDKILDISNPFTERIIKDFPDMKFASAGFQGAFAKIKDTISKRKKK